MPYNPNKPNQTKCISLKVNIIVQLEFKLTYHNVTVQQISRSATGTHHQFIENEILWIVHLKKTKIGLAEILWQQ